MIIKEWIRTELFLFEIHIIDFMYKIFVWSNILTNQHRNSRTFQAQQPSIQNPLCHLKLLHWQVNFCSELYLSMAKYFCASQHRNSRTVQTQQPSHPKPLLPQLKLFEVALTRENRFRKCCVHCPKNWKWKEFHQKQNMHVFNILICEMDREPPCWQNYWVLATELCPLTF